MRCWGRCTDVAVGDPVLSHKTISPSTLQNVMRIGIFQRQIEKDNITNHRIMYRPWKCRWLGRSWLAIVACQWTVSWPHWHCTGGRDEQKKRPSWVTALITGGSSRAELNCRNAHHTYPLDASRTNPLSVQTTNNSVMDQLITGHQWTAPL